MPYEGAGFTIKLTKYGGPDGNQTHDLPGANRVLSQLSYQPILIPRSGRINEAI